MSSSDNIMGVVVPLVGAAVAVSVIENLDRRSKKKKKAKSNTQKALFG